MCSAPPAVTTVFLVLSSGSAIRMPPGGGRRLPWKSLIARIRSSTGAAVWASEDAASVVVIANARITRKRRLMMLTIGWLVVGSSLRGALATTQSSLPLMRRDGLLRCARNDGGEGS